MRKARVLFLIQFMVSVLCFGQDKSTILMQKGVADFSKGDFDSALVHFSQCVQVAKVENKQSILSNAYNNLGNCYANTGNPVKALSNYQQSISIAEAIGDSLRIAKTLKNIGTLYSEQKDFLTAMQFYEKALKLALHINDSSLIADCFNNQGVVYEQQNNFLKAAEIYLKALVIYRSVKNEERVSMTLNNLGIVYKNLGNYKASLSNYSEALNLAQKAEDKFMISATINNMGGVYSLLGDYTRALLLYKQALELAKKIGATEIIIENYDGLANAYEGLHQFPEALSYRKLYEQEKSNFINTQRSEQLAEMQTKYETQKKEVEIKLLKQNERIQTLEIAEQKLEIQKRNYLLFAILFMVFGLVFGLYFWFSRKQLKQKIEQKRSIKQTEENERIRIAKDIHDDLGSGLSKINFLSELITQRSMQYPEIKSNSEAVSETTRRLVDNMRDLIWALNPENTTLANLAARVREYASDYLEDFPVELTFKYPESIPNTTISKESYRGIFMVMKESLNNIVKHASASKVCIGMQCSAENISFSVVDNGIGFNAVLVNSGNGLRNMKNRIHLTGGTISFETIVNEGTQINLSVPINKVELKKIPL